MFSRIRPPPSPKGPKRSAGTHGEPPNGSPKTGPVRPTAAPGLSPTAAPTAAPGAPRSSLRLDRKIPLRSSGRRGGSVLPAAPLSIPALRSALLQPHHRHPLVAVAALGAVIRHLGQPVALPRVCVGHLGREHSHGTTLSWDGTAARGRCDTRGGGGACMEC